MNDNLVYSELLNLNCPFVIQSLSNISNKKPKVPQGYFNDLPRQVELRINEAPILFSIQKKEINSAPANYFENIKMPTPAVEKRNRFENLFKLAIAAGVTLLIFVSIYFFKFNNSNEKFNVENPHSTINMVFLTDELTLDDLENYYAEITANLNQIVHNEEINYLINEYEIYESDYTN